MSHEETAKTVSGVRVAALLPPLVGLDGEHSRQQVLNVRGNSWQRIPKRDRTPAKVVEFPKGIGSSGWTRNR